jgi:ABC-2 type transport system ATP-binding protein
LKDIARTLKNSFSSRLHAPPASGFNTLPGEARPVGLCKEGTVNAQAVVEVHGLTHFYGKRQALDAVTFFVEERSLFALLGPNGSGKTTLFRILTTVLAPSSGTATVAGADIVRHKTLVRRSIGVAFQEPSLDDKLTVMENLVGQGHLYGLSGRPLRQRCAELLSQFGVADRTCDRVETLSGGLRRRVELAKAMIHRPKVLILDEPGTGLDPGARLSLMGFLEELRDRDGVTCLLTTHLMDEADRCDRVGIMDEGKLKCADSPSVLKAMIGGEVLTVATSNPALLARKIAERFALEARVLDGVVRIERARGHQLVKELAEAFPGECDSITVGKVTLGDVFEHLTGHGLWNGGGGNDPTT